MSFISSISFVIDFSVDFDLCFAWGQCYSVCYMPRRLFVAVHREKSDFLCGFWSFLGYVRTCKTTSASGDGQGRAQVVMS